MTHDHDLTVFADRLRSIRERAAKERPLRRLQWEQVVQDARESWRHDVALVDRHAVHSATRAMIRVVVEWRLLLMFSGLLVRLERMERSAMIVKILASPSGAGPRKYAQPKHRK